MEEKYKCPFCFGELEPAGQRVFELCQYKCENGCKERIYGYC